MHKRITKILAAASPHGDDEAVRQLGQEAQKAGAQVLVLLGSLTPKGADPHKYGQVLKALSGARIPAFYVPGPEDAPMSEFLREAASVEVVYPDIHGVHGTFAMASGQLLISGLGGLIDDDPKTAHDENEALHYPGWELAYRLKFLRELKDYQKIFLFTTPPARASVDQKGSAAVTEMIKTYHPTVVLVGGKEQKNELVGTSRVIALGSLADGTFKLVDLKKKEITGGTLHQTAPAA